MYVVVTSLPAIEEIGAMSREIESRWGKFFKIKLSRSAFFDEKSIPFHERYPHSP
jgi:hypothetical protein